MNFTQLAKKNEYKKCMMCLEIKPRQYLRWAKVGYTCFSCRWIFKRKFGRQVRRTELRYIGIQVLCRKKKLD